MAKNAPPNNAPNSISATPRGGDNYCGTEKTYKKYFYIKPPLLIRWQISKGYSYEHLV